MVEKIIENQNVEQDQQDMLLDKLDGVDMNIPDDESGDEVEEDQTPTPVVASNRVGSSQYVLHM